MIEEIRGIEHFWTRQFAFYLNEHRDWRNRATHIVGIPMLIVTALYGIAVMSWQIVLIGQIVGWVIQLIGHRFEGNRPALLKNPTAFAMGPMMVLVEIIELTGFRFTFADNARRVLKFQH